MLEGTIKLHGEQGSGKTQLIRTVEETLRDNLVFKDKAFRIVAKTQLPGQPEQHEATFTRRTPGGEMRSTWSEG